MRDQRLSLVTCQWLVSIIAVLEKDGKTFQQAETLAYRIAGLRSHPEVIVDAKNYKALYSK